MSCMCTEKKREEEEAKALCNIQRAEEAAHGKLARDLRNENSKWKAVCNLIKDSVRLRVMSLSLTDSNQVFDVAEIWQFHVKRIFAGILLNMAGSDALRGVWVIILWLEWSIRDVWDMALSTGTLMLRVLAFNVINGGSHTCNKLAMHEFMILPVGASYFKDAMKMLQPVVIIRALTLVIVECCVT
ncbi:Enolase domain-containing protein [Artemisia annua]|uniref:phosphopyruvate hydratase n=1 Tax=Artemisia annua TaxID=35608 RepID=A0A2U1LDE7_ARTAN|nr:Enolase domain-containing protein [Artemisia annua]